MLNVARLMPILKWTHVNKSGTRSLTQGLGKGITLGDVYIWLNVNEVTLEMGWFLYICVNFRYVVSYIR